MANVRVDSNILLASHKLRTSLQAAGEIALDIHWKSVQPYRYLRKRIGSGTGAARDLPRPDAGGTRTVPGSQPHVTSRGYVHSGRCGAKTASNRARELKRRADVSQRGPATLPS